MSDHDALQLEPQFAANVRNVRSFRERIVRSPGGTLLAPPPDPSAGNPGYGAVVGTFTKQAGTGNQTVSHSLGHAPSALILYSVGTTTSDSVVANYHCGFGFTDGTTSRSVCSAQLDNIATGGATGPSPGARRMTATLLQLCNSTGSATVLSSATFVSFSSSNFIVNWTTNDGQPAQINYIIIGATNVHAKVIGWRQDGTTSNQVITGAGFKPQVVIHLMNDAPSLPFGGSAERLTIGAMDDAGRQFAYGSNAQATSSDHESGSALRTDCCLVSYGETTFPTPHNFASYVSMDTDGFTVTNSAPTGPSFPPNYFVGSLCLNGLDFARVGTFNRTTASAPTRQDVTGLGFMPVATMLVECGSNNNSVSVGAADTVSQFSAAYYTAEGGSRTSTVSYTTAQRALVDITSPEASRVANAIGTLIAYNADGFTLNYTVTNSRAAPVGYVALKFASSTGGLIGIPRNYPEVYVDPSGPATQKYVMLTHKSAFIYTPSTPSTGVFTPTAEAYTGNQYQRFSIANTQGIAAWSQGVDNIREWDGTNFSALVTSGQDHAARALISFADRIVSIRPYFGGADHPTQIRWCINGDVNDWNGTGSGVLEIIETSQDPLITGFVLADRAFLAKRREIIELLYTGTLSPVFGTVPRIRGMGVLAPHSVALAEQLAFWLGPDDVYMFDGSTLTAIGERMYNTITSFINYQNLDVVQGAVYTPDSQYHLVIPPYKFVYDYRRDIWDWDDVYDFQAIGTYNVGDGNNFTADIDKSEFIVVGDSSAQTTRVDFQVTGWLGAPIDSYFETKDYTADDIGRQAGQMGRFSVSLWDLNSLREVRFQGPPGNIVEVGISLDRGATWELWPVTINQFGVGAAWFQRAFSIVRFRFRDFGTDSYEIRGQWGFDVEQAGYNIA
jgi:hypothetical protein